MTPRKPQLETEAGLDRVVEQLTANELREVLTWAAEWHTDVERRVRLTAARSSGDLRTLRAEVDRGLRTRRFLGYRESVEWARAARPVVTELDAAVRAGPSRELVELLERGIGHVVKVIQTKADDSSGTVGDLARDLLDVHASACDAGVADPVKLARWMIRFRFVDQDFFEPDPVLYRAALGEVGLAGSARCWPPRRSRTDLLPGTRVSGSPCSTVTAARSSRCSEAISRDRIGSSGLRGDGRAGP